MEGMAKALWPFGEPPTKPSGVTGEEEQASE